MRELRELAGVSPSLHAHAVRQSSPFPGRRRGRALAEHRHLGISALRVKHGRRGADERCEYAQFEHCYGGRDDDSGPTVTRGRRRHDCAGEAAGMRCATHSAAYL